MKKTITILGATGSIGRSAADVLEKHSDKFAVEAVVGGKDVAALAIMAKRLGARYAAIADSTKLTDLRNALAGTNIECGAGDAAILEASDRPADIVLAAIAGTAGLRPTYAALKQGRRLALANKESLVCAGHAFMRRASELGVDVAAVDSEHNALQQALMAGQVSDVSKAIITASGGPFRKWSKEEIAQASAAQASRHPVWSMGAKILIDSATLMNKGLELIEACHLFSLKPSQVDVVVHPDAIVHAIAQWRDGAVTAGLAAPDMRIPIANALGFDARLEMGYPLLDFASIGTLNFEKPDEDRFPCLALAKSVLAAGGALPAVMNAANEVAVAAYQDNRIGFYEVYALVARVCDVYGKEQNLEPQTVEAALWVHAEATRIAREQLRLIQPKS